MTTPIRPPNLPIGGCVVIILPASNTLTQPSPPRERAFRGAVDVWRLGSSGPLSFGGEEWRKRSGGSFYQPLGEGVTGGWRFVRTLWFTLIQLRLVRSALKTSYPSPYREKGAISYSSLFRAINNSCRIASNTPSRLSFTSLFQNRITRNPNASSTAVRAASSLAISAC